jgi:hypothetical protein
MVIRSSSIIKFLQFRKEWIESGVNEATLQTTSLKQLNYFFICSTLYLMRKITRRLFQIRRYPPYDRELQNIGRITEHSDRRIKAIVYNMTSS